MYAQGDGNPCAQYEKLYENKVAENIALKTHVNNLKKDSAFHEATITALRKDSSKTHTQLNVANNNLTASENTCKKLQELVAKVNGENTNLKNQLSDRTSLTMQQYKDSIGVLNKQVNVLIDTIGKISTSVASLNKEINKQKNELKQLNAIVDLLSKRYEKTSVDELFSHYNKGELMLYKDLCPLVGKKVSTNVEQAFICYRAQEQLKLKYDKFQVEQLQRQLLKNTKIGKELYSKLQVYETTNKAAFDVWQKIKVDVFSEVVENSNFAQTEAKRATWYRTQKFLNQYPNLAEDYPYIYAQLQNMLRQVWDNPNNFNKINNPFE